MIYLGSSRIITQDFINHGYAEDYAGDHKSEVKINGKGKVTKIISRFISHENSINYQTFLKNQSLWKDGNVYHCISITGTQVDMSYEELGGNQIFIETYTEEGKMLILRLAHLDRVMVSVGEIVDENTILGYQGNTGLVFSSKEITDESYGSHVHLEVRNQDGIPISPRQYADGTVSTFYEAQTNSLNQHEDQFRVIVDCINIREEANTSSKILGMIYMNEIYTILEKIDSTDYTWYKITTNRGITGYIASKKSSNWVEVMPKDVDVVPDLEVDDQPKEENESSYQFLFECKKDGVYYIKLTVGEQIYLKAK